MENYTYHTSKYKEIVLQVLFSDSNKKCILSTTKEIAIYSSIDISIISIDDFDKGIIKGKKEILLNNPFDLIDDVNYDIRNMSIHYDKEFQSIKIASPSTGVLDYVNPQLLKFIRLLLDKMKSLK